jgi:hypothetical protein
MGFFRSVALAAAIAGAAPATAAGFYAAGFAGGFARSVALDPADSVVACRVTGSLADGRQLGLERWAQDPTIRLWTRGGGFQPERMRLSVIVDGEAHPLDPDPDPGAGHVGRLPSRTVEALLHAEGATLDAEGRRTPLPGDVGVALRYLLRCPV